MSERHALCLLINQPIELQGLQLSANISRHTNYQIFRYIKTTNFISIAFQWQRKLFEPELNQINDMRKPSIHDLIISSFKCCFRLLWTVDLVLYMAYRAQSHSNTVYSLYFDWKYEMRTLTNCHRSIDCANERKIHAPFLSANTRTKDVGCDSVDIWREREHLIHVGSLLATKNNRLNGKWQNTNKTHSSQQMHTHST